MIDVISRAREQRLIFRVSRVVRAGFGSRTTGVHQKLTLAARWGKPVRHPGHASPTKEDDHEDLGEDDVLDTATRALEQGQIHRPEAAVAAKAPLVDPHQTADGRVDA